MLRAARRMSAVHFNRASGPPQRYLMALPSEVSPGVESSSAAAAGESGGSSDLDRGLALSQDDLSGTVHIAVLVDGRANLCHAHAELVAGEGFAWPHLGFTPNASCSTVF